jgi:tRNA A-37 threonylcarbamoyl transferase component Bud32
MTAGDIADAPALVSHAYASGTVVALPTLLAPLVRLVDQHGTLYAWAEALPQPHALRGRAPVYVATIPGTANQVVVRHAWHGGAMAPLTRDLFRPPSRAPREVERSHALRRLGVPTTEIVGYALYRAPLGLVRVDVLTRYIPETADLGMVLAGLAPGFSPAAALNATDTLLQQLAANLVVHPDLNVKNILLRRSTADDVEAVVIDVDVVQIGGCSRQEAMQRNVARLVRSLQKWHRQFGGSMTAADMAAFAAQALARSA